MLYIKRAVRRIRSSVTAGVLSARRAVFETSSVTGMLIPILLELS